MACSILFPDELHDLLTGPDDEPVGLPDRANGPEAKENNGEPPKER